MAVSNDRASALAFHSRTQAKANARVNRSFRMAVFTLDVTALLTFSLELRLC
jgi:hypothetical protein